MTRGNSRISESFGEGPGFVMCQRPRTRPMTHCNERLQVKLFEQNDILNCVTQRSSQGHMTSDYVMDRWERQRRKVAFKKIPFMYYLFWGGYKGGGQKWKD